MNLLPTVLEGLVPIAWMDRAGKLCADPRKPTAAELFPSDEERRGIVDKLCLADTLVAGGAVTPRQRQKRSQDLSAVASAIAIGAAVPGGIRAFGTHWWMDEETGQLRSGPDETGSTRLNPDGSG